MDFYAFWKILYANLESLSLFYKITRNQEHYVQESRITRIRKEKLKCALRSCGYGTR